jgi:hypothetical protein
MDSRAVPHRVSIVVKTARTRGHFAIDKAPAHIDLVDVRAGVPNEAVNRASMVPSVGCPLEANARAVTDPSAIQHAAKGEVLIMKGDRHGHGCGLVHRSPPVEHLGLTRVVLVISAVERA